MKREDSKPASDSRTMTRKISHKNLSDGYISLMDAQQTKQLWSMACPKASISEADIENYIPLPYQIQQEVDESESEPELVFARSISEDVLTQPQSLSESVVKIMTQTVKHNSDAILALPKIRDLLMEDVGHADAADVTHLGRAAQEELCGRGGVKHGQTRTPVEELVQDKYYEGQIVKRTRAGLLIDINALGLGLLRWKLLRGVPRNLQKIGGFLANLVVTKVDQGRFSLKLHTIGFHKETMEETDYQYIHECVHHWSGLPGLPGYRLEVPEGLPEIPEAKAVRVLASREERLRRQGKMGPRF